MKHILILLAMLATLTTAQAHGGKGKTCHYHGTHTTHCH